MNAPTLRPATAEDQRTIRRMIWRAGINPVGLDWPHFLVAEQEGQIIGIGQIKSHGDGSRELASLAVAPPYQGQGVGGAIIHTLLAEQAPPVYLMCAAKLGGYYPRFGFTTIPLAEMPPYFRRMARLVNLWARQPRLLIMKWEG